MRFRMACPGCRQAIGFGRSALRGFFLMWLCPLPVLAWLASLPSATHEYYLLVLPAAWLILFPMYWLTRVRLVPMGS